MNTTNQGPISTLLDTWIAISDIRYRELVKGCHDLCTIVELKTPHQQECETLNDHINRDRREVEILLRRRFHDSYFYENDVGMSRDKYVDRLYVQHQPTGNVFCLSTYFNWWRIIASKSLMHLVPDFCKWIGPDFMIHLQNPQTPQMLKETKMIPMNSITAITGIDSTLAERASRYGSFTGHAKITQDIKRSMAQGNWPRLADDQKECLEMLAHKIGRILNGDPDYHDSWHDLVGYSKLVADRLAPIEVSRSKTPNPSLVASIDSGARS